MVISQKNYLAIAVSGLCILSLIVWRDMPYYPDEVALQFYAGRFIQDKGVSHGLFALCSAWGLKVPMLLALPAWLLSKTMLLVNPVQFRIFPLLVTLTIALYVAKKAVKGVNPLAVLIISTGFIGVAGSGLTMARPEFIHLLNLLFCLLSFVYWDNSEVRKLYIGIFVLVGLLASASLSVYVHIQGVLFVPLSIVLAILLCRSFTYKIIPTILSVAYLFGMSIAAIIGFSRGMSCDNYPGIQSYLSSMTVDIHAVVLQGFFSWVNNNFVGYSQPFLYNSEYAIGYLPSVEPESIVYFIKLRFLNWFIRIILFFNLFIFFWVLFFSVFKMINGLFCYFKAKYTCKKYFDIKYLLLCLIVSPIVFLYAYDAAHNFYRTFFLNYVIVVVVCLSLAGFRSGYFKHLINIYALVCVCVVASSLLVNFVLFNKYLKEGFVGPSIALNSLGAVNHDILELASACKLNMDKGRIIVDDLTYESMKRFSILFPITYLDLQGQLTGLGTKRVLDIAKPRGVIARCSYVEHAGLVYEHKNNGLCCANYNYL
ncbi:hypothetical protein U737_15705 [Methylomonas sp. LW13]|uniref:hypothetical protein n=1 Tax=unclassified Methylomonas TaxID=2608980 RepID=UPI00051ADC6B|nr:hypothetical protein [Methylomonas sp. LW13]QBC28224.1 hypothetical protein U737_15705 [Methylomonas sp. LW13]